MKFGCLAVCLSLLITSVQGATVANYSPSTNDRFANDESFIAASFDLSGVGLSVNGKWVTMLSNNVFITSNHLAPSNGESVTFYETNDPNGNSLTRSVLSTQRIGNSDLRIGVLSSPLTSSYGSYDFATENISDFIGLFTSPYYGEDAYVIGRSPSEYATSQDMVIGRNILNRWFENAVAGGTTDDAIGANVDLLLQYETNLAGGDSGAPMFVEVDGKLRLVGVNWFVGNDSVNDVIGMSYVGNYDQEILDYINLHAVPEPSTGLLVLLSGSLLLIRRRR